MFVIKNLDTGTQMRIDDFDRLAHIATDPDPAAEVGGPQAQRTAATAPCTPSTLSLLCRVLSPTSAQQRLLRDVCCPHVQEAHPAHKKGGLMKGTKALKHW